MNLLNIRLYKVTKHTTKLISNELISYSNKHIYEYKQTLMSIQYLDFV